MGQSPGGGRRARGGGAKTEGEGGGKGALLHPRPLLWARVPQRTVGLALALISLAPPSTLSKSAGVMMRTMPAPHVAPRHCAIV